MKLFLTNIFLFSFFLLNIHGQTDWEKWGKKENDYLQKDTYRYRNYNFETENAGKFILKTFINGYWFFISDVDGDNCPFRPSCSAFFFDAVKETNVFQGSLMFFDRFTRDLNVFKTGNYPRLISGRFYDPPNLYSLSKDKIIFIPQNEIVTSE